MIPGNKHFTESDRIFYSDGYRIAQSAIEKGFSDQALFKAIESMYEAIDGLNDSIIASAKRQNSAVSCYKGCHWCCHQAVFANSYELHYLGTNIKKKFSSEEVSAISKRTEHKYSMTLNLNDDEVLNYKAPCPLLKNDACKIYDSRPMACRIYLSTKLETCLEFYHNPEHKTNYPALIDFPLSAGRMMNEGFRSALKGFGIETTEFRFENGLRIVLNNDQSYF